MIKYKDKEYKRAIVFGDSHGLADELRQLIDKCDYDATEDLLCSVGDLVDRGLKSAFNVKFCRQLGVHAIKGNHEQNWLGHRRNKLREISEPGFKNKKRAINPHDQAEFDKLTDEDWTWMEALPDYIEFESDAQKYLIVHAGFLTGDHVPPWKKQDPKITARVRYQDKTTEKMIPYQRDNDPPPNSYYWTEQWNGPQIVIYGHQIHDLEYATPGKFTWGIDTGGYKGGHLTAMIIEDSKPLRFEQVKCEKICD